MGKELLVVGIDPGTTVGLAVLDINGKLLKLASSKNTDIASLTSKIIALGKPLLVGCDKNPAPGFAEKLAIRLGAKLVYPDKDLLVKEKRELNSGYKTSNSHEFDALASALFALKEHKPLIKKIDHYVDMSEIAKSSRSSALAQSKQAISEHAQEHAPPFRAAVLDTYRKQAIRDRIVEVVIRDGISISMAAEFIDTPEKWEAKAVRRVVEKKEVDVDLLKLYEKLKAAEKADHILKKENLHLKKKINKLNSLHNYLRKKISQLKPDEKAEELLGFKEEAIRSMQRKLDVKDEEISYLQKEINFLNNLISGIRGRVVLKKLKNLGYNEFDNANKVLNISENDVLLVDDPNIFSSKTVDFLKGRVNVIVSSVKPNNELGSIFIFIDKKNLEISENKHFAVVDEKELKKEIDKHDIVTKVVDEYRKKR